MAEERALEEEDFRGFLQRAKENDSTLTKINLNNLVGSKPEWMIELFEALESNTQVETVWLVNTGINGEGGKKLAELLKTNRTITNLNVETNKISGEAIRVIAEAIEVNSTLLEIKLTNQAQLPGNETERILAKAVDANKTLQRCTATLVDTGSRNTIDRAISRNKELARKARQAAKK